MRRSIEFSGRTVDEAIFHGLTEMGVTIDEVEIETLQTETKGLFGFGSKLAIVRLTEREAPVVPDLEQYKKREADDRPRAEREERGERGNRGGGRGSRGRRSDAEAVAHCAPEADEVFDYSEELAKELDTAYENVAATWISQQADPAVAQSIYDQAKALVEQYNAQF